MQKDEEIVLAAGPKALFQSQSSINIGNNKKLALELMKQDVNVFSFLPMELRDNEEVVCAAVNKDPRLFAHASPRLRWSISPMLKLVREKLKAASWSNWLCRTLEIPFGSAESFSPERLKSYYPIDVKVNNRGEIEVVRRMYPLVINTNKV